MTKKYLRNDKFIFISTSVLISTLLILAMFNDDFLSFTCIAILAALFISSRSSSQDEYKKETDEIKAENHDLRIKKEISEQIELDLTKANTELKDFAYTVSHDLKAPLRAISSLATWILEDNKEKFDEESINNMNVLIGRTKRMNKLIEGILECSKIGHASKLLEEVDSKETILGVIDSLGIPENFKVILDEDYPKFVYDETHLHQVFQNFVSNAVKYIDKPIGEIRISCTDHEDNWEFCIQDNGPGIEKKHHERVFKIFHTLQARDKVESTGVGLTVIKKIVETHGGEVKLRSVMGKGSSFYFTVRKDLKPSSKKEKEKVQDIELRLENQG